MSGAPPLVVQCPVCSAGSQIDLRRPHAEWALYQCPSCEVQHFWPARNPGAEWYEASEIYLARDADIVDWLAWYHRRAFELMPTATRTLLDVGCGNGAFVARARERGLEASGVDFSEAAVSSGRRLFGIEQLYAVDATELATRFADPFDVVTAFEVLEHMDRPGAFLSDLVRLTDRGGRVIVSVPNRDRVPYTSAHGDVPPHHFTRWNERALRKAFDLVGLDLMVASVSPARTTIKIAVLELVRTGIVERMLRRSGASSHDGAQERMRGNARGLILLKDRIAEGASRVIAPVAAPFVRGAMLVAVGWRRDR